MIDIARKSLQLRTVASVRLAVRHGVLVCPLNCSCCGSNKRIEAHHEDYDKPYDVEWLCHRCHVSLHCFGSIIRDTVYCPECDNPVVKAGIQRFNRRGDRKQMYVCTNCRRRTVNPVKEGM